MNQQDQPPDDPTRAGEQSDRQPDTGPDAGIDVTPDSAFVEPVSPDQFHEMLQQRPDGQQLPTYEQPQYQPQYGPSNQYQYAPPPPQGQAPQTDYRPDGQPTYSQPVPPPQYGGGDYRPDQQPQHGGYYPPQPQQQYQQQPYQPQPYYMDGQPPGPPATPPKKRGTPAWAWKAPLVLFLLAAGSVGGWLYLSSQEKADADARATSTAVARSNATSTAQVQRTSTAIAGRTTTAVAQTTSVAEADNTATAISIVSETSIALQESPTAEAVEPVRMPVDEFIALNSDPAQRPIIVDVRSKAAYDEGHIAGAVSIPDAETESRLSEFPKDKLIVAYCQ